MSSPTRRFTIKNRFKITIVFMALIVVFSIGAGLGYALFFGGGAVNLPKGLVAHWKFDGNAKDATPNSGGGNTSKLTQALGLPVRIVEEQTLTADAASITFTSIDTKVPSGSRHLVLMAN